MVRKQQSFTNKDVKQHFTTYPTKIRQKLMELRSLIFETAAENECIGEIEETLKWNQPAYLTSKTKSGSSIRIDQLRNDSDSYAVYFHCQTNLVESFREIYPQTFSYEKNRAIILQVDEELPNNELRHCISMALTYHHDKKKKGRA